jgi:hypothetical protein
MRFDEKERGYNDGEKNNIICLHHLTGILRGYLMIRIINPD